ncbi:MAG: lipocalin family protein [Bacteroidetes bacterium]|nr:lipocalin family protein [Bacteroidota bacterium]MBI3481798.1 lipocalin family protein [Bacteroidota bacterium]
MRAFRLILLVGVCGLMILACSKDKTVTPVADTNGAFLAGAKGASKSWKISAATGSQNGGQEQSLSLDDCFKDNVFKFSNNSAQDYENTEGSTKCVNSDSILVEKGTWAFTSDGKTLLIDGTSYSQQNVFTGIGKPVSVLQLSDATMKISFSFTGSSGTIVYYLNFVKI